MGMMSWWHDADFVVRGVFITLVVLSLVSWTLTVSYTHLTLPTKRIV